MIKFNNCVSVNNGVDWSVMYTKHPCPPKKKITKKRSEALEDDLQRKKNREAELENEKSRENQSNQETIKDNQDFQEKSQDNFQNQKNSQPEKPPCCNILMQVKIFYIKIIKLCY